MPGLLTRQQHELAIHSERPPQEVDTVHREPEHVALLYAGEGVSAIHDVLNAADALSELCSELPLERVADNVARAERDRTR